MDPLTEGFPEPPSCQTVRSVLVTDTDLSPDGRAYWLEPADETRGYVLYLHGYGQTRAEALVLAMPLAIEGYAVLVPDLPGHGSHPAELGYDAAIACAKRSFDRLALMGPVHVVGFSLGARLAFGLPAASVVALSPPKACFDGSRTELLRTLRVHAVREAGPTEGLVEALSRLPDTPMGPTLTLYAQRDLSSVKEFVSGLDSVERIEHADHLGLPTDSRVVRRIIEWLRRDD